MSTKDSLYYDCKSDEKHKLNIHIFNEMNESDDTVKVGFYCATCNCCYEFLMAEHLGKQLIEKLEKADKYDEMMQKDEKLQANNKNYDDY